MSALDRTSTSGKRWCLIARGIREKDAGEAYRLALKHPEAKEQINRIREELSLCEIYSAQ